MMIAPGGCMSGLLISMLTLNAVDGIPARHRKHPGKMHQGDAAKT